MSEKLVSAVTAGIPIISATTTDVVNLTDVLEDLLPDHHIEMRPPPAQLGVNRVWVVSGDGDYSESKLVRDYWRLAKTGNVLLLINGDWSEDTAFPVGEILPAQRSVVKLLSAVVDDPEPFLTAVSGLTIKTITEVIRLTQARTGALEIGEFLKTRSSVIGERRGLAQVQMGGEFYQPDPKLQNWCDLNRPFWQGNSDLAPKGLLLVGDPGVGKSQGAKFVAEEFGLPLYRLDISGSLGRYVGESESNLRRSLSIIDAEEPAALLIDEVDKLFGSQDDGGVTSRLLSQLLWWLQEHKTKILVLMTTNNLSVLPPELYRPGRIDQVFEIDLMKIGDAIKFAYAYLASLPEAKSLTQEDFDFYDDLKKGSKGTFNHSQICAMVRDALRRKLA